MSDDRNFDPRFDPAFQRGYDGVVDARPRPTRTESAAPAPAVPVADEVQPTAASVAGAASAPLVEEIPGDDPLPPRVNPFLIALALIAVVLVGAGFYLVARIPALYADSQNSTDFDFVTLQVLIGAAPLAIALGIATAVGILFMLALRWGRR